MDHRWGHRVPVDFDVEIACGPHGSGMGRMENASASGAFVRTSFHPPLLAHISLIVRSGTCNRTDIHEMTAYVVRQTRRGIGIEWSEFASAAVSAVLAMPPPKSRLQSLAGSLPA